MIYLYTHIYIWKVKPIGDKVFIITEDPILALGYHYVYIIIYICVTIFMYKYHT